MRDPAAVFVANAAWSMLGLVVGFVLGRMTREIHEVHEVVAPLDERLPVIEHPPHPLRRDGDKTRRRDRWLAIALVMFAVASVATAALAVNRRSVIADCQADYNARVVLSIKARAKANDADRASIVDLVRSIAEVRTSDLTPQQQADATQYALQRYLDQSAESSRVRQATPLPEVVTCP